MSMDSEKTFRYTSAQPVSPAQVRKWKLLEYEAELQPYTTAFHYHSFVLPAITSQHVLQVGHSSDVLRPMSVA